MSRPTRREEYQRRVVLNAKLAVPPMAAPAVPVAPRVGPANMENVANNVVRGNFDRYPPTTAVLYL